MNRYGGGNPTWTGGPGSQQGAQPGPQWNPNDWEGGSNQGMGGGSNQGEMISEQSSSATSTSWMSISGIALGLSILLLFAFIGWMIWYFLEGYKVDAGDIKKALENSDGTDAVFENLTVKEDTVLGTTSSDTVNVKASVSNNFVPDGNKTRNLGSSTRKWDNLYVDQVVFDGGVSIISETDVLRVDGELGYRRNIIPYSLTANSGETVTIPSSNSGAIYVIDEESNGYDYEFDLPSATGSGIFYDFTMGTSIISNSGDELSINPVSGDYLIGSIDVQSYVKGDPGVSNSSVTFQGLRSDQVSFIILQNGGVLGDSPNANGGPVLEGSTIRVTDTSSGYWTVDGSLIIDADLTPTDMNSPFNATA